MGTKALVMGSSMKGRIGIRLLSNIAICRNDSVNMFRNGSLGPDVGEWNRLYLDTPRPV